MLAKIVDSMIQLGILGENDVIYEFIAEKSLRKIPNIYYFLPNYWMIDIRINLYPLCPRPVENDWLIDLMTKFRFSEWNDAMYDGIVIKSSSKNCDYSCFLLNYSYDRYPRYQVSPFLSLVIAKISDLIIKFWFLAWNVCDVLANDVIVGYVNNQRDLSYRLIDIHIHFIPFTALDLTNIIDLIMKISIYRGK